ncbi:MAG: TonB-dependent receptor, partial [Opitutaceae bacterium]
MNISLPRPSVPFAALLFPALGAAPVPAASAVSTLPGVVVTAPAVANLAPAGTFAMPVTALRYEPRIDLQARNLAEAQADITLRGGTFETTGYRLGALSLADPQTGHYLTELPLAPAMLGVPQVLAGAEAALGVSNATAGAIAQDWRPVSTGGFVSAGAGQFALRRAEIFAGAVSSAGIGIDVGLARSRSDGAVRFGDHDFNRASVRLQSRTRTRQTDAAVGYQGKRFGWPNLYTPFGSPESENLQTLLLALNHRVDFGGDNGWEAAVAHRRNKDDYAFNRFAPLGPVHPFQHTTWVTAGAAEGRWRRADWTFVAHGEAQADRIASTSLTFGRYRSRMLTKAAAAARREWAADGGRGWLRLGLAHDDSNRDDGVWLPVAELGRSFSSGLLRGTRVGYAETSQLPSYTSLNANPAAGLFRGNANLGRSVSRNLEAAATLAVTGWAVEAVAFTRRDDA